MESTSLLDDLREIPLQDTHGRYDLEGVLDHMQGIDASLFSIEVAAGAESSLGDLFDWRNVNDDVKEAYRMSSPSVAEEHSLFERYSMMKEEGPDSARPFVRNIRSKLGEIRAERKLEEGDPSRSYEIAADQNQGVWDIKGVPKEDEAEPIRVQVKTHEADNAHDVAEAMQEDPDVLFAVSRKTRQEITSNHPELSDQFVEPELSGASLREDTEDNLELLAENQGLDVPDGVGEIIPYATEVVLGIQFLYDIAKTEKDLSEIQTQDRGRLHALSALTLGTRFGISTVCTTAGSAAGGVAGSAAPGIGNAVGSIGGGITGAVGAYYIKKKVMPHAQEIGLELVDLTENDLFYLQNKGDIDEVGASLMRTSQQIS